MIKIVIFFVCFYAIIDQISSSPVLKAPTSEVLNLWKRKNLLSIKLIYFKNSNNEDEYTLELKGSEDDFIQSLVKYLEENPEFLIEFLQAENNEKHNDSQSENSDDHLTRNRRRLSVFKNIYHQCRIQKRKEKDFCLQIANLYQNVKGFHGI